MFLFLSLMDGGVTAVSYRVEFVYDTTPELFDSS